MRPANMFAYIGHCPLCGRVHAMITDTESDKSAVAKEVASMIRNGLNVERVTVEQARESNFGHCTGRKKLPTQAALFD